MSCLKQTYSARHHLQRHITSNNFNFPPVANSRIKRIKLKNQIYKNHHKKRNMNKHETERDQNVMHKQAFSIKNNKFNVDIQQKNSFQKIKRPWICFHREVYGGKFLENGKKTKVFFPCEMNEATFPPVYPPLTKSHLQNETFHALIIFCAKNGF